MSSYDNPPPGRFNNPSDDPYNNPSDEPYNELPDDPYDEPVMHAHDHHDHSVHPGGEGHEHDDDHVTDATVRNRATVGELQDIVEDLIAHLHEAKTMPLSSNVLVDREQFLVMLEKLRAELPDELRAARWMVREREAFIARTNEKAQDIIDKAKVESRRLVSESHVVAEAVEEANILVRRAEGEARRLRLEAEDEIERSLERVENLLSELLGKVHYSREELHKARPKPPDVPL